MAAIRGDGHDAITWCGVRRYPIARGHDGLYYFKLGSVKPKKTDEMCGGGTTTRSTIVDATGWV